VTEAQLLGLLACCLICAKRHTPTQAPTQPNKPTGRDGQRHSHSQVWPSAGCAHLCHAGRLHGLHLCCHPGGLLCCALLFEGLFLGGSCWVFIRLLAGSSARLVLTSTLNVYPTPPHPHPHPNPPPNPPPQPLHPPNPIPPPCSGVPSSAAP